MEDMLKGYIIKSRVRESEKLLLAQPYSPHLFRQGVLPGPGLLLDVLTKDITTAEAKTAWKAHEKAKAAKDTSGENWLQQQTGVTKPEGIVELRCEARSRSYLLDLPIRLALENLRRSHALR